MEKLRSLFQALSYLEQRKGRIATEAHSGDGLLPRLPKDVQVFASLLCEEAGRLISQAFSVLEVSPDWMAPEADLTPGILAEPLSETMGKLGLNLPSVIAVKVALGEELRKAASALLDRANACLCGEQNLAGETICLVEDLSTK